MVRHLDAIYSGGAFRPVEPIALPEGTRVHLSVEEQQPKAVQVESAGKVRTPRLARPADASDFVMDVRESGDAAV